MKFFWILVYLLLFKNGTTKKLSYSEIINTQLAALKQSLVSLNLAEFQNLFDKKKVNIESVFQPEFMYPNNVFASMGDSEFKNSLQIFTAFEPTPTKTSDLRALITIKYKLMGQFHKMEKEVIVAKSHKSSTGYVFTGFTAV